MFVRRDAFVEAFQVGSGERPNWYRELLLDEKRLMEVELESGNYYASVRVEGYTPRLIATTGDWVVYADHRLYVYSAVDFERTFTSTLRNCICSDSPPQDQTEDASSHTSIAEAST